MYAIETLCVEQIPILFFPCNNCSGFYQTNEATKCLLSDGFGYIRTYCVIEASRAEMFRTGKGYQDFQIPTAYIRDYHHLTQLEESLYVWTFQKIDAPCPDPSYLADHKLPDERFVRMFSILGA